MNKQVQAAMGVILGVGSSFAIPAAHAGVGTANQCPSGNQCQWLFNVGNDDQDFVLNGEKVQQQCEFYLMEVSGQISGLHYECNNSYDATFTYAQLSNGVVINSNGGHTVISIQGQRGFDAAHGGALDLKYLVNGKANPANDQYKDFTIQIQNTGAEWIILTGPSNGQTPFDCMFFKTNSHWLGVGPANGFAIMTSEKSDCSG